MNKNKHSYSAKDITKLSAIESIRLRSGMYIGSIDENGLHHLLQEVISNSIDEFLNGFGTRVDIMIDEKTNTATVVDDGRGIPFGKTKRGEEAMIEIATSLHAGGKFGEGGYSVSGGLHGIGLTAVNALSTHFKIVSNRDKQTATYTASRGETKSYNVSAGTGKVDGTLISFTPDTEIFGKHKFNLKRIEELVREMSYLTSGMKFYVNGKLFYSDNGLKDMIKDRSTDPITDLTYIVGEVDGFKVEIAFLFEPKSTERVFAFTNNIPNKEGGTHITGFRTAFTTTMNKLARQYNLIGENDANLSGDMMRRGMVLALSLKMNKAPVFQGQTKEKLMTAEARGAVSQVMGEFFEKTISKKDVKTIVDRALVEQRAEDAAKRSREAAKKMAAGGKDMKAIKDLPSKLADCRDRNGELWILEGDSAAGTAKSCRDPKTQAIMPLRGKVLNTHDKELADIIKNKEVKDIMTALGTGVADQFKLYNLRYSKIIILADADSDGSHINLLVLTIFLKHMPELVKANKVYMALPPLYKVSARGKNYYYYSDEELTNGVKGEVTRFKGIGEMSADELWETTMDPKTRTLIQLTTDNLDETLQLFETLMGKSSAARKQFILDSNLLETDDDYYGEEVMD